MLIYWWMLAPDTELLNVINRQYLPEAAYKMNFCNLWLSTYQPVTGLLITLDVYVIDVDWFNWKMFDQLYNFIASC
jgi:hypothetical protein